MAKELLFFFLMILMICKAPHHLLFFFLSVTICLIPLDDKQNWRIDSIPPPSAPSYPRTLIDIVIRSARLSCVSGSLPRCGDENSTVDGRKLYLLCVWQISSRNISKLSTKSCRRGSLCNKTVIDSVISGGYYGGRGCWRRRRRSDHHLTSTSMGTRNVLTVLIITRECVFHTKSPVVAYLCASGENKCLIMKRPTTTATVVK